MSVPLDIYELQGKFEINMSDYTGKAMLHHIPMDLKKVRDFPKKVEKIIPMGRLHGINVDIDGASVLSNFEVIDIVYNKKMYLEFIMFEWAYGMDSIIN